MTEKGETLRVAHAQGVATRTHPTEPMRPHADKRGKSNFATGEYAFRRQMRSLLHKKIRLFSKKIVEQFSPQLQAQRLLSAALRPEPHCPVPPPIIAIPAAAALPRIQQFIRNWLRDKA